MIRLKKFGSHDYENLISWISNKALPAPIAGWQMTFPILKYNWVFAK
jgi:hypothetical protein